MTHDRDAPWWHIGDHVDRIGEPGGHGRILKIDDDKGAALVEWRNNGEQSWQAFRNLKFRHHAHTDELDRQAT